VPHAVKYAEADLIAGLRSAAEHSGVPLTVKQYDDFRRAAQAGLASGIWVIRHFGTWRTACERAGLAANTTRSTSSRWTDAELLRAVADYLAEPGTTGSYAGYQEWARGTEGAPSGALLRSRFGTWAEAKQRLSGAPGPAR
jgi:hypothetical protein